MEAVAKMDFTKSNADELSFKSGSVVKVLNTDDKDWYIAEQSGEQGYVPSDYLTMRDHEWYYGKIKRHEAEEFLLAQERDGSFLVRESESTPGDFSVSVKSGNQVLHYKVLRDGKELYFLWVVKFESLNELIDYHITSSVSRSLKLFLRYMPMKYQVGRALHNCVAQEAGELQFNKGDIIIIDDDNGQWWTGRSAKSNQTGKFPSNYIEVIDAI